MRNFLFSSLFLLLRGKYFLLFFSSSMNTFNILFLSSCSTIQHILKSMDCEITAWRSDSLQILTVLFSFSPLFFFAFLFRFLPPVCQSISYFGRIYSYNSSINEYIYLHVPQAERIPILNLLLESRDSRLFDITAKFNIL